MVETRTRADVQTRFEQWWRENGPDGIRPEVLRKTLRRVHSDGKEDDSLSEKWARCLEGYGTPNAVPSREAYQALLEWLVEYGWYEYKNGYSNMNGGEWKWRGRLAIDDVVAGVPIAGVVMKYTRPTLIEQPLQTDGNQSRSEPASERPERDFAPTTVRVPGGEQVH